MIYAGYATLLTVQPPTIFEKVHHGLYGYSFLLAYKLEVIDAKEQLSIKSQ